MLKSIYIGLHAFILHDLIHVSVTPQKHSYHTHVMVRQGHFIVTGHIPGLGVQYLDTGITTGEPDHCFTPTPPSYHLPHYTILSPSTRPLKQTAESTSVSRANPKEIFSHSWGTNLCGLLHPTKSGPLIHCEFFLHKICSFCLVMGECLDSLSCVVLPQIWSVLCVTCPHKQKCLCTSRRYAAR